MKIAIVIALMILYKLLSNLVLLFQIIKIQKEFIKLAKGENVPLSQNRTLLKNLITRAGIKDSFLPTVSNLGYGHLASYKASVLDNFPNLQFDHAKVVFEMMDDAIGVYKSRCFDAVNPLFWIETLIFLPKTIFLYLGVDGSSGFIKFFQVLYWFLAPIIFFFKDKLNNLIISFINQL